MRNFHSHHRPAEKGNKKHHGPRGDDAKVVKRVGNGDREVVLGKGAVKGVEDTLDKVHAGRLLALRPLLVKRVEKVGRGDGGEVQALPVDVDGGGLGKHVKDPEGRGAGGPDVAEDGLLFAVEDGEVGRVADGREFLYRLAKGLVDGSAAACDLEIRSVTKY